jgi:CRISPR system Cascade subunit CasD
MSTLLLRLQGPLQAWATQSRFGIRDTDREPSKSGVLGLAGAALGMEREDDTQLQALASLSFAVRVDRPGTLLHDYQTAGGGKFRGSEKYFVHGVSACVPSHRYLLQDASFVAALHGDDALLRRCESAFANPKWPLFLGRRACPPSAPVLIGVSTDPLREAIKGAPFETERHTNERVRIVADAVSGEVGDPRNDVPVSFSKGERRYRHRNVVTLWMDGPQQTLATTKEAT